MVDWSGLRRVQTIMGTRRTIYFLLMALALFTPCLGLCNETLPAEPDLNSRVEEIYDHEARLFLMLYSLRGNGVVDYITGRVVEDYSRSSHGNPVYTTQSYPLFYWWNHTMWNDPEQDGVNGNERVYQEDVDFDTTRYKPCTFNKQPC